MQRYQDFAPEDFAADDSFCRWVLQPDDEKNVAGWQAWLQANLEKNAAVQEARNLVLRLAEAENQPLPAGWLDETWQAIERKTAGRQPVHEAIVRPLWAKRRFAWAVAATATLLLVASSVLLFRQGNWQELLAGKSAQPAWLETENTAAAARRIELPDGSVVTLEPGSFLKHPTAFGDKQREVTLRGEAFFEIAKDASRPFFVFANETVTKVLGTSFRIKAWETGGAVEVTVETGKVAVYALPKKKPEKAKAVVATPNQRVVFDREKEELRRTLAEAPKPLAPLAGLPRLKFEEAPVGEIFAALENAYGINIVWDEASLKNCALTTTLTEQSLFEKMAIICDAIGVSYEQMDTSIIVSGQGCR